LVIHRLGKMSAQTIRRFASVKVIVKKAIRRSYRAKRVFNRELTEALLRLYWDLTGEVEGSNPEAVEGSNPGSNPPQ